MKKTILFFCVISLVITHRSCASPEKESSNNMSGKIQEMPSVRKFKEVDVEAAAATRTMLLLPRELSARTKILAGMGIGIPLVCIAAYVGLH